MCIYKIVIYSKELFFEILLELFPKSLYDSVKNGSRDSFFVDVIIHFNVGFVVASEEQILDQSFKRNCYVSDFNYPAFVRTFVRNVTISVAVKVKNSPFKLSFGGFQVHIFHDVTSINAFQVH